MKDKTHAMIDAYNSTPYEVNTHSAHDVAIAWSVFVQFLVTEQQGLLPLYLEYLEGYIAHRSSHIPEDHDDHDDHENHIMSDLDGDMRDVITTTLGFRMPSGWRRLEKKWQIIYDDLIEERP